MQRESLYKRCVSYILQMYDFDSAYENIYTGETDIRLSGLIEKYNGNVDLPQWSGKCANVNGASDGTKFPSFIQPNDTILFFRKSLCRSERMVISVIAIHFGRIVTSSPREFSVESCDSPANSLSVINFPLVPNPGKLFLREK